MRVFISTSSFAEITKEPLGLLRAEGIRYTLNPYRRRLTKDEISNILRKDSYTGLIAGTEPLTKEVLRNAKALKVISRVGTGLDNIDLDAAGKLNIEVYNTPHVVINPVAELTIGLILSSLRRLTSMNKDMCNKIWKKEMGLLFRGKVLGIIGFGKIGKRVAELAEAFGAKVIFYDIKPIKHKAFTHVPLNKLLKDSDIISIHSSTKKRLIKQKEISKMKRGVVLINTSRGSVINEHDLYKALKSKKIAFCALDVFDTEPYSGRLTHLENVMLTPHIGSYAKETRVQMEREAVENLMKGLREVNLL